MTATFNRFSMMAGVEMTPIECYKCGIVFCVPTSFDKQRHADQGTFYCPDGHGQIYRQSSLAKLQGQLAREKEVAEALRRDRDEYRRQTDYQKRRVAVQKGLKTRLENRIKNGVCPCCNRTFQDLQKHMKSKHPEFATTESKE